MLIWVSDQGEDRLTYIVTCPYLYTSLFHLHGPDASKVSCLTYHRDVSEA